MKALPSSERKIKDRKIDTLIKHVTPIIPRERKEK